MLSRLKKITKRPSDVKKTFQSEACRFNQVSLEKGKGNSHSPSNHEVWGVLYGCINAPTVLFLMCVEEKWG